MSGAYEDGMGGDVGPFVDDSSDIPTIAERFRTSRPRCKGSNVGDGECEPMGLSFETIDEWEEHRRRYHPTSCFHCYNLSSYIQDGSPHGYCIEHMPGPDEIESPYRWKPNNREAVVDVPTLPDDHPVSMALGELDSLSVDADTNQEEYNG